jgi:hypothetical protein
MSSILKKILADHAKRPVDPNPPWGYEPSEAVEILKLRLEKSQAPQSTTLAEAAKKLARTDPAYLDLAKSFGVTDEDLQPAPEPELGPATRESLQTIHHIEHLERQLAMEQMRVKELRAQREELERKVRDGACTAVWLQRRYGEIDKAEVVAWVESELFPTLRQVLGMPAGEKGGCPLSAKREKWVLGYTARATQEGSWNVVFVPEARKKDIEDMKPVPEAKRYRVEEYTETRAIVAARKLLKAELAKAGGEA